ncbi:MAG: serine/threonine-protein kinase [Planctomycetota bacterium]|nr:serine/threonine-protein kinase [Planctomycetota bacterium]
MSAATAAEIVLWNLVREPGTPSVVVEQLVAEASLDTQTLLALETEADRLILFAGDRSLADLGEGGVGRALREKMERARAERRQPLSHAGPLPSLPPRIISGERFLVTGLLAQGGQGLIFAAVDRELGRAVALKFLRVEGLEIDRNDPFQSMWAPADRDRNQSRVDAFLEEARRTSRLAHPGILDVYELGVTPGDIPFYVMPLVDGPTLGQAVHERYITPLEGLRALGQVAEALAYAHHDHALVHGDVNPDNLILDEFGSVYVLDWGAARYTGSPVDGQDALGSLGYVAPEVLEGTCGVQPSADVFALGVLLFELLTGSRAFPGNTPEAYTQALQANLPISSLLPVPAADERLSDLCNRCLSLDPARRPRDAGEFAATLQAALAGRRRE